MSNAAWLENAAQTARQLCDSRGFRVGVAVFLGLPIGAFALAGGVFGGVALYGLLSGVRQGNATAAEVGQLLTAVAVFGIILLGFLGVALRLIWPSAILAQRPARERGLFLLLTVALIGFVPLALVQPNPLMLSLLALVALCWLGTQRPKSSEP